MSVIKLKLLIDVENNKVVLAESEEEFIDILFSFLTLPIGTIIRLLNKQSSVGCIDNIYKSVEILDTKFFNTKACKTMLLEPRCSAERLCEDLSIRADNHEPRRIYRCPKFECYTAKTKAFSSVAGVSCSCGETMNAPFVWKKAKREKKQVFIKEETTYVIGDDLHVFPATISNAITVYQRLGIDDVNALEKRFVDVNRDQVLSLLKMLLLSKTPLTDVFLNKPCTDAEKETNLTKLSHVKLEDGTEDRDKKVFLKLMRDKSTKRALYAEADHVIADTIFSFLTFPLGSMVKLLNKQSFLGCADNLYNSVDILASTNDCFVSEERKKMLVSPCLYLHYDSSHQILKIESEALSRTCSVHGCKICWDNRAEKCEHNISEVTTNEINPKMQDLVTDNGGGFANKSSKFMITDELMITPQSLISGIDVVKDLKVSVHNLVLEEVAIGEAEVLNLLKACLTSSGALNSAFSSF